MSLVPVFEIGIWNAWLFMIIFPLQWLAVIIIPRRISERVSHPANLSQTPKDKLLGWLNQAFWLGATLYSAFLPLKTGTAWFYTGLGVFAAGLVILVWATLVVTRTTPGQPFTKGPYRFSRHPMYLAMLLVYAAVSLATVSWLFSLITVITVFLQRQQMIQEEAYCGAKFGSAYLNYRNKTPRWLGIPQSRPRE